MSAPVRFGDDVTAEQYQAIALPPEAHVMMIAAAGTGKTHTLVRRLEHLLDHDLSADEVLVLSFSRAAVRELRKRASSSSGRSRFVNARTFDAWALDVLSQTYADHDWQREPFDKRIKTTLDALVAGHVTELLSGVRHVLLDEIQDLVGDRREMVKALLTTLGCGFTAVGDPAQAIYGFQVRCSSNTSGESEIFTWFRRTFADGLFELRLTHDFRARTPRSQKLIDCGALLREPSAAKDEDLPRLIHEEFVNVQSVGPLEGIVSGFEHYFGSCAILCRDNGQAMEVSATLHHAGVRHRLQGRAGDGGNPRWLAELFRRNVGLTISETTFAENTGLVGDSLDDAWASLLTVTRARSNTVDIGRLRSVMVRSGGLSRLCSGPASNSIIVSAMHRAKGLEYDRVFVLDHSSRYDSDPTEEAHLLYMAMTRCRDDLFRLEPLKRSGTFAKRCPHSHRWGRYRFQKRGQRLGLAMGGSDLATEFPAGRSGFAADPHELQKYLAEKVKPGDPVTLRVGEGPSDDDLMAPTYTVDHGGRSIGVVSQEFRRDLGLYMFGRRFTGSRRWPVSIDHCWIEDVVAVAGSVAAGRRAGLGDHGVWLGPRLTGLTWFNYGQVVTESEHE